MGIRNRNSSDITPASEIGNTDDVPSADDKKASVEEYVDDSSSGDGRDLKGEVHDVSVDAVHDLAEKHIIDVEGDVQFVMDKIEVLNIEQCREILTNLLDQHTGDYNFNATQRAKLENLLLGPQDGQPVEEWETAIKTETAINKFYSPYPEVRAITQPNDDPSILCETIRK